MVGPSVQAALVAWPSLVTRDRLPMRAVVTVQSRFGVEQEFSLERPFDPHSSGVKAQLAHRAASVARQAWLVVDQRLNLE